MHFIFSSPSHQTTCVYTTVTRFTEGPKKARIAPREKSTPLNPTLTSSGERPTTETAQVIQDPENRRIASFFCRNATPLAVVCVYLRSSHLPSRTAVFLRRITPGEPSTLTLCGTCRTREKPTKDQLSLGPSCTFQAISALVVPGELFTRFAINRITLTECGRNI